MSRLLKAQLEAEQKRNKFSLALQNHKAQANHGIEASHYDQPAAAPQTEEPGHHEAANGNGYHETDAAKSKSNRRFLVLAVVVGVIGVASILLNAKLLSQLKDNRSSFAQLADKLLAQGNKMDNIEKSLKQFKAESGAQLEGLNAGLVEVNQAIVDSKAEIANVSGEVKKVSGEAKDLRSNLDAVSSAVEKNTNAISDLSAQRGALQAQVDDLNAKNKSLIEQYGAANATLKITEDNTAK